MSIEQFGSPKLILVFSGKRKSGKDYITNKIIERIGATESVVIRLSGPLKEQYAKDHGLDYSRLLDASQYKENFRTDMILWSEEIRRKDSSYFCRHAILQSGAADKHLWIVSDARRKTDISFFKKYFPLVTKTVRVCASDETRKSRGWVFTPGVDDVESECGLDDFAIWDFVVHNESHSDDMVYESILKAAKEVL